jgi:hypothetical protein
MVSGQAPLQLHDLGSMQKTLASERDDVGL